MVTFAESTGHVYRRSSPKTKTFFCFVWNRKSDRISRDTAVKKPIANGSLGTPQIKIFMNALKLIWIRSQKYKPYVETNCMSNVSKRE